MVGSPFAVPLFPAGERSDGRRNPTGGADKWGSGDQWGGGGGSEEDKQTSKPHDSRRAVASHGFEGQDLR